MQGLRLGALAGPYPYAINVFSCETVAATSSVEKRSTGRQPSGEIMELKVLGQVQVLSSSEHLA
jgi:hypothetical protein